MILIITNHLEQYSYFSIITILKKKRRRNFQFSIFLHNLHNIRDIKITQTRLRWSRDESISKGLKRETREQGQTSSSDDVREHSRTTRFNSSSFSDKGWLRFYLKTWPRRRHRIRFSSLLQCWTWVGRCSGSASQSRCCSTTKRIGRIKRDKCRENGKDREWKEEKVVTRFVLRHHSELKNRVSIYFKDT